MRRKRDAERSRGRRSVAACVFSFRTDRMLVMSCILVPPAFSSDITTLTSASYQSSLPMHAGQHLLSIQGEVVFCISVIWWIALLTLFVAVNWSLLLPLKGSPVSHSRPGALLGERSKQLFPAAVIPVSYFVEAHVNTGTASYSLSSSSSWFRHVTIRRRGSARAQQSTDSSVGARRSMSPMGWPRPSIPPLTPLDHLYLSVLQAALRSEVKGRVLIRFTSSCSDLNYMNVGAGILIRLEPLLFSSRCVCVSGHAVPPPPAAWLPSPQSLHLPAWLVPPLSLSPSSHCCFFAADCKWLLVISVFDDYKLITNGNLCMSHRIHSWSGNTPPEAAGTCQPTVRLYWCSKNSWHSVHWYD